MICSSQTVRLVNHCFTTRTSRTSRTGRGLAYTHMQFTNCVSELLACDREKFCTLLVQQSWTVYFEFVKMTLFFTIRRYTFCDLTILTKLKLQLCALIPTDIHTQTRKPGVGVRTFFGTSRSTKFAVTNFPFRGHIRQS